MRVTEIAREAGVSRRALVLLFRRILARTVYREIRCCRIEALGAGGYRMVTLTRANRFPVTPESVMVTRSKVLSRLVATSVAEVLIAHEPAARVSLNSTA